MPLENKFENQILTDHTASLTLAFWHTPRIREKYALLFPPYASAAGASEENLSDFGDICLEIV
ncbi:MAG: hypothetical protein AMXMBFR44_6960 [Candidatus Campbellbacteria bacterium]